MWADITALLESLGVTKGLFVIFFIVAHGAIFSQYRGRINQMQSEINRLAADNHKYRDRFLSFIDKKMKYNPPKSKTVKKGKS